MRRMAVGLAWRMAMGGVLCAFPSLVALAERLPVTVFTAADGLAGDSVNCLEQDRFGFLWIGSSSGLTRFDGTDFTRYGREDGLPHTVVTDLLETSSGELLVVTFGGLARLAAEPRPNQARSNQPRFEVIDLSPHTGLAPLTSVLEDSQGGLWLGSQLGVLHRDAAHPERGFRPVELGLPAGTRVGRIAEDRWGTMWIAAGLGLVRRLANGALLHYFLEPGEEFTTGHLHHLRLDRQSRLWTARSAGVSVLAIDPPPSPPPSPGAVVRWEPQHLELVRAREAIRLPERPGEAILLTADTGLPLHRAGGGTVETSGGRVWLLGDQPMLLHEGALHAYTGADGLVEDAFWSLLEDREGNLWLGTEDRGLLRVAAGGFRNFGAAEGLTVPRVTSLFTGPRGELIVAASGASDGRNPSRLFRYDGHRFAEITPPAFARLRSSGWGWNDLFLRDRRGEWWLPSGEGLMRFAPVTEARELARARPLRFYGRRHGLGSDEVFRVFEDSRSDLWISTQNPDTLSRWLRESGEMRVVIPAPGMPGVMASAFAEDGSGRVWVGLWSGDLCRFRGDVCERFAPADHGLPRWVVFDLHRDRAGRLWSATGLGLVRIDRPESERPSFTVYTTRDGLSSDRVLAITEDLDGRLFLATARGVDRLEPESGRFAHYTTDHGLPNVNFTTAYRDPRGALWFGTQDGLARFDPAAEPPPWVPPVYISSLRRAGQEVGIEARSTRRVEGLELAPGERPLEIEAIGVSLAASAGLRYQHRLLGSDDRWSPPGPGRTFTLLGLPVGHYRFQVRAVTPAGTASSEPAEVAFSVLPPLWQRAWFLALTGTVLAGAAYAAHRLRLARLLAVERTRTRIASDLHDDLGSSLSRISVLSEVGKLRLGDQPAPEVRSTLGEIGDTARELTEAMGDIVWAIDPRRDDLQSLLARLRRFAGDHFEARGVALSFEAPAEVGRLHLGPERRRELYLILKEALHNASKHARPTRVGLHLAVERGELVAVVEDDGPGLPASPAGDGRGLRNMQMRAALLRGRLTLGTIQGASAPEGAARAGATRRAGTRVELRLPL